MGHVLHGLAHFLTRTLQTSRGDTSKWPCIGCEGQFVAYARGPSMVCEMKTEKGDWTAFAAERHDSVELNTATQFKIWILNEQNGLANQPVSFMVLAEMIRNTPYVFFCRPSCVAFLCCCACDRSVCRLLSGCLHQRLIFPLFNRLLGKSRRDPATSTVSTS